MLNRMPQVGVALCLLMAGVSCFPVFSAHAESKTWTGGNSTWSNPTGWTPVGVPAAADEIQIESGSIHLDMEVTIGARLTWSGGSLHSGSILIAPGALAELVGEGDKEIQNATFVNAGTLQIAAGRLVCRFTGWSQSVRITNQATGLFELADTAQVAQVNPGSWPPAALVLANEGVVRKTGAGSGALALMPLANQGRVEVVGGHLEWTGGGTSPGTFQVLAGCGLDLHTGTFDLGGSRWDGPGPVRIRNSATVQGTFQAENFGIAGGDVTGHFDVSGGFEWTGGHLVSAAIRLGEGQHRIAGDGGQILQNTALVNAGHLVTDAAVVGLLFTGYSQFATLTNEPAGVIELRADSRIQQVNAGGWSPALLAWVNQGQLISSTAGTNWIESIPLHNEGGIDVAEGLLRHTGGGVCPGQVRISPGARIQISGGTYNLGGSRWTGAGEARIVSSTRLLGAFEAENFGLGGGDLEGEFDVSGGFEWTAGRVVGARARLGRGGHSIRGEADKVLHNATLANAGHLRIDNSSLALLFTGYSQTALLTNEAGGILEWIGAAALEQRNMGGWTPAAIGVVNEGTVRASGPGPKSIAGVPLHNRGLVEVAEGTLLHTGGGTSPGTFSVAAAGRFEFSNGTYQYEGSRWFGTGPAAMVATATVQGAFDADNFRLERGDLSGTCTIGGGFHWLGGNLVGAQLRLGPGEHRISGPDSKVLLASSLANAGHLVFEEATVGLLFTGYSQVAFFTNEAGGQMDIEGGARIEQRNGGGWSPAKIGVFNEGTVRNVGGGVAVLAAVPLVNQGVCEVIDGILRVEGNATFDSSGQLTVRLGFEPSLQVTGTATLGGALEAATPPGFEATSGAAFTPMSAGTISGRFANDIALNPGHLYQYLASYSGNVLTLTSQSSLEQPLQLSKPTLLEGLAAFDISGRFGLIYLIESSTNLVAWQIDFTTNAPADTLTFVDPRTPLDPARFYRVGVLP